MAGRQHEKSIGRRFLQSFEKSVRRVAVQEMSVFQNGDLRTTTLAGGKSELAEVPHGAHLDLRAVGHDPAQIRMRQLAGVLIGILVKNPQRQPGRQHVVAPPVDAGNEYAVGQPDGRHEPLDAIGQREVPGQQRRHERSRKSATTRPISACTVSRSCPPSSTRTRFGSLAARSR